MRRVRFTEAAEADYTAAHRWYAQVRRGLDDEFTAAVDASLALVVRRPEAFRAVGTRHRRYVMRRFPFTLLFRFDDEQVVIEALFHHKLNPDILRQRLRNH